MSRRLRLVRIQSDERARAPESTDTSDLAELMLRAYRGTVDDEGEGLDEARTEVDRYFEGDYGQPLPSCSEVVIRSNKIVAATLLTLWEDVPLVAFSMTLPAWKRKGLARAGMVRCMNRLLESGYEELHLFVTKGNNPAELLYEGLGFSDTEPDA